MTLGKVVLVSLEPSKGAPSTPRQRFVAFLPMTVAVLGALVVLVSGLVAEPTQVAKQSGIDPVTTGSVTPSR